MLKDTNYVTIQAFMVRDLRLKGVELMAYAVIFGFTQDDNQTFRSSLPYLMEWCACSKPAIIEALKSLIAKGLIEKRDYIDKGVRRCEYTVKKVDRPEEEAVKKLNQGGKESLPGVVKKVNQGGKETLPNNDIDNINYNNNDKYNNNNNNISEIERNGASAYECMCELMRSGYLDGEEIRADRYNLAIQECVSQKGGYSAMAAITEAAETYTPDKGSKLEYLRNLLKEREEWR